MIKATEALEDLSIILNIDEDDVEEYVVKAYLAICLKPLIGIAGINKNRLNNIADFFVEHYLDNEYSLDVLVNALYNYINSHKTCPSDKLLTDEIETFLEEYSE